jgi:hypothetical protein
MQVGTLSDQHLELCGAKANFSGKYAAAVTFQFMSGMRYDGRVGALEGVLDIIQLSSAESDERVDEVELKGNVPGG